MRFELGDVNEAVMFDPKDADPGDAFMVDDTVYLTIFPDDSSLSPAAKAAASHRLFEYINTKTFTLCSPDEKEYLLDCEAVKVELRLTCRLNFRP